ncbi:MAG: hypothetical protein GF364_15405 [Candidatus Lokiarchaeota archaeon]|nr:hypothetical protein [Candidatus Lokiarchaeota archaeon]
MSADFSDDYSFRFIRIFGNTPRIKILEFFVYLYDKTGKQPWSYISQLSRLLKLSKSSVKKVIDSLIYENILIEKKIETHAKHPKRNISIKTNKPIVLELLEFYRKIKHLS